MYVSGRKSWTELDPDQVKAYREHLRSDGISRLGRRNVLGDPLIDKKCEETVRQEENEATSDQEEELSSEDEGDTSSDGEPDSLDTVP